MKRRGHVRRPSLFERCYRTSSRRSRGRALRNSDVSCSVGNVLALAPPFTISDDEIEFLAAKLQEYLTLLPGSIS